MKIFIQICSSTVLLLLSSPVILAQFNLLPNGVTVECTNANVGETGTVTVNGATVTYTKRTKAQITQTNAATTCTSGITDMSGMFSGANTFNGDISSWDVSSVMDMSSMFNGANSFNQDLSRWCVTNITSAPTNFGNAGTDPV